VSSPERLTDELNQLLTKSEECSLQIPRRSSCRTMHEVEEFMRTLIFMLVIACEEGESLVSSL
jgi:hypothetical protein